MSKASVAAAEFNMQENGISNTSIARLTAEEFTAAWKGVREFERAKSLDLKAHDLQTILVDPPRAGDYQQSLTCIDSSTPNSPSNSPLIFESCSLCLFAGCDADTATLLKEIQNVLYISCNPETLHNNLLELKGSHKVLRFAIFDQFPYTDHIECGVYLRRKE